MGMRRYENITPEMWLEKTESTGQITGPIREDYVDDCGILAAKHLHVLMRDEVEKAIEKYNLPISPEKIECIPVRDHIANGSASVLIADEYWSDFGAWGCDNPQLYSIQMPWTKLRERSYENQRKTVRHELAHIMGWHTEGVTYERQKNHKKWLKKLDAW